MDGKICCFWVERRIGNCGAPTEVRHKGLITSGEIQAGDRGAIGLVDDRIKTIRAVSANLPDEPVTDNVFQITDLPNRSSTLIGLDASGHEVLRTEIGQASV